MALEIFKPKTYTNGAYEVLGYMHGIWRWKRLRGTVIKSRYPHIYDVGTEVDFPKYHLFWDKDPQFKLK